MAKSEGEDEDGYDSEERRRRSRSKLGVIVSKSDSRTEEILDNRNVIVSESRDVWHKVKWPEDYEAIPSMSNLLLNSKTRFFQHRQLSKQG